MHHYVYRILEKPTLKFYIGLRSSEVTPKKDLGSVYFSSSSDSEFINNQKMFPENYIYSIINTYPTRKAAAEMETALLEMVAPRDNVMCFNASIGYHNNLEHAWNKGFTKQNSPAVRKYAKSLAKTRVVKGLAKGDKNPMFGRNLWEEKDDVGKQKIYNAWKRSHENRTDDQKRELRNTQIENSKDRVWMNNNKKSKMPKKNSTLEQELLNEGWHYGRLKCTK